MGEDGDAFSAYPGRYGGVKLAHPTVGSWVIVRVGAFTAVRAKVVSVEGYVFDHHYRVYVEIPDEASIWFWPWELEPDESLMDEGIKEP